MSVPASDRGPNGAWWYDTLQIDKIWATGARGQGITVAVVDTGVDTGRPWLAGNVLPGFHRRDPAHGAPGHGTWMSTLIAGRSTQTGSWGVAPRAKILPLEFTGRDPAKTRSSMLEAARRGAKVINLSFGGADPCDGDDLETVAVRYAVDRGAIVVASAGNSGGTTRAPQKPADCPGVLTVGMVDQGLRVPKRSSPGDYLALSAPGWKLRQPDNDGRAWFGWGTSDAAAVVSGVAALVWSAHPELTNRQVVARLLATARDLGPPGHDDLTGYGLVQPYRAITEDIPADAPNPTFDRLDDVIAPGDDTPDRFDLRAPPYPPRVAPIPGPVPVPTTTRPPITGMGAPAPAGPDVPEAFHVGPLTAAGVAAVGVLLLVMPAVAGLGAVMVGRRRRAPRSR